MNAVSKIEYLKNEVSKLNEVEFGEFVRYLNEINTSKWLKEFILKNKEIEITEDEIINLVKETRKQMYESSN